MPWHRCRPGADHRAHGESSPGPIGPRRSSRRRVGATACPATARGTGAADLPGVPDGPARRGGQRTTATMRRPCFVSRKTVEAHLIRVHRKLGVRSRVELSRCSSAEASPRRTDSGPAACRHRGPVPVAAVTFRCHEGKALFKSVGSTRARSSRCLRRRRLDPHRSDGRRDRQDRHGEAPGGEGPGSVPGAVMSVSGGAEPGSPASCGPSAGGRTNAGCVCGRPAAPECVPNGAVRRGDRQPRPGGAASHATDLQRDSNPCPVPPG